MSVQHDDCSTPAGGVEWEAELLRRANEALGGIVTLHDVDESHAQVRAELAALRRK